MAEPIKLDYVPKPIQANTGLGNSKQPIQLDYIPEPIAPVQPAPKGLGTVARGVQAGGYETLGTLGGLTAMGGEALGLPEVQKAGLKYAGEQFGKAEELGQGIPTRIEDIKNVGDALQFGLYTGGSILPSVALSATGAGLGVAGTKELAKKEIKEQVYKKLDEQIAKKEAKGKLLSNEEKAVLTQKADKVIAKKLDKLSGLGGTAGIAATSIPQEVGSVYAEQAQTGKTDVGAALTSGIAAGLLDTFSAHKMLSKFGLLGGKNLEANRTRAKSLLGAVVKGGATQAGIEGLTEGAQTFIEKLGVKYANPSLSLTDKNAILDYLNSTIAGSIGGGTFGGLGGGLSYKPTTDLTGGKPLTQTPAQPTAPQAPQPQAQEQPTQPQIAAGAIHPQQSVSIVMEHPPSVTPDGRTIQTPASITAVKDKTTLQIGQKIRIGKGKGLNEEGYVAQIQPDGTIVYTTTPEEAQQYAVQQQQVVAPQQVAPTVEPVFLTKEPTPATMKEPITEKGAGVEKYVAKEDNPVFLDWQKRQEIIQKAESGAELTPEEAARFGYTHDKAGLYNTTAYKRWVKQDKDIEKQPHLYMDLDNFKKYNDEYGHDFGDTLIKYVGERLSKLSPTDRILGLGGDEFAAVHPDADVLNNIAEGLKKDLANAEFEIKNLKTGKIDIVKGLKLSHGVGKDFKDAKEVTSKEKEAKLLTGERYVRGTERKGAEFRKAQGTEQSTGTERELSNLGDNIPRGEKVSGKQPTEEVGSPSIITTPAGREIETVFVIKDINKEQDTFARIAKGGMDKAELEKGLEPLLALNKKRNLETKVLQSVEDLAMELPENGQRKVENLGGDISGFIYGHKIFIIADNIRSVKEGYKTLNHEVAHFGLRQVLNDKEFDQLLRQVWIARNEDAKDIAELYKLDTSTEKGRLEAAEEVLAHLAETDANNTWVQKAIAIIARWLREHGIDIKLTDSEIREILMIAKNYDSHIKDKDKYSSLVDGRFQIIAYHGTDGAFQEFDDRYISRNNALGYGFYFTDKKEITRKYGENLFDVILHEGKTPDQYDYMEYYQPISKQQASKIVDTANAYGIKEDMMARRLKRGVDLPTGEEVYRWLEEVGQANGIRDPFSWVPAFLTRAGIDGTVDTEPGRTVWCVFNSSNISIKNIAKGVAGGRASLIGKTGAQELSSAHMDNLETAKKMEGEGAKNTAIYFATGWEKGVDGEWRMELDTDNFSLKYPFPGDKQVVSISDLIKFPELFKAYPNLKDMEVEFNQDILDEGNLAEFDPAENKINLSPALRNNLRNLKSTLLHEMQHWIQSEEGFALGTNITEAKDLLKASKKELKGLKPDEVYARAAGEVEARNIETRAGILTAEERKQIPPSMTEDRKREQQLVNRGISPEIPNAKKLVEPTVEDEAYKQQNKVIKMARMSADTFPTDAGYKRVLEIEAQRNNVNEFLKNVSSGIDDASKFLGKFFSGIDESLGYIDERLKWRLRRFENTYRQGLTRDTTEIKPFLKALSLMKEGMAMRIENGKEKKVKIAPDSKKGMEDYLVLDFALKNGDMAKINEIVKKYGIEDEYKAIKPVLKNLLERAKEVGYEFGEIENYFPRAVKDPKGLVQHLRQMDGWSIIDKNIDEKSKTLGRNLTDEEILDVVATTLRGYKTGVSLPQLSNMKKRLYGKLKPDMNQYYHTAETSLMAYLERTHEGIATREFFGKANVKEGGVKDSIDQYVQQLRKEGRLSPSQEKEVIEILNSRFNYRQMNPFLSGYRNLEYIDTMGSPISAITQIGDLAFSIYFNGHYTGKALLDAATNKERVTKYKAGIENITNEFTGQHNKMARAVNVVFKLVGLEKMDAIGKETFMNSTVAKYRTMAKNPTKEFLDELELIMGNKKDADQLLKDLQESKLTPLTETFAVLKLMDVQPLTLSQMPLKYIDSPNGRIFYMLKSYTIKQFNVFRKQCFDLIYEGSRLSASKDPKEKARGQKMLLEGVKRMIALTSTLVFMGITTDFIKDWMLGRETEWDDKVINNLLRLIGLSKYTYFQAKQEGTSKALLMTILPPAKLLDNVTKDSFEQKGIDKTIQSVPLVGSMFYWWLKHFREQ